MSEFQSVNLQKRSKNIKHVLFPKVCVGQSIVLAAQDFIFIFQVSQVDALYEGCNEARQGPLTVLRELEFFGKPPSRISAIVLDRC